MKKNLITSLKKLYAAFGGKDPTKDNAVDIVDKIADSVDNMESMSYEDWQKEDEEHFYFPNGREGFSTIPVINHPEWYGENIYIKDSSTNKVLLPGWEEYIGNTPSTETEQTLAECIFVKLRSIGNAKFLGQNFTNSTFTNNVSKLYNNIVAFSNSEYFKFDTSNNCQLQFVSFGGTGDTSVANMHKCKITVVIVRVPSNNTCKFTIWFNSPSENFQRYITLDYNYSLGNIIDCTYRNFSTIALDSNRDKYNPNCFWKYDEDGYFTLAPDNKAEKALVVTITENNNTFTADKTYTELYDAFLDRQIFCLYNGNYYSLTNANSTRIFFTDNSVNPISITISNDNSITIVE